MASTKGESGHIGLASTPPGSLEMLPKAGCEVTDEIKSVAKIKYAFIEGPDKIRIELVEGHATRE